MQDNDTRQISRDSLYVMAKMRLDGKTHEHNIKMRNLSAGGAMVEATFVLHVGQSLSVDIRNIGWVDGLVAWVQENRFGIIFHQEIDPKIVRGLPPSKNVEGEDRMLRRPIGATFRHPGEAGQIRNI